MKNAMPKLSLIILTYNRPDALGLILKSIKHQTVLPDEVIIADDGSAGETESLIGSWQKKFPVPLLHAWHVDIGYRIAAIRNRAVEKSTGSVLVFSDGDLFFHPRCIEDFKKNIRKGEALIGSRVFLSGQSTVKRILEENIYPAFPVFSPEIESNRLNSVRMPFLNKFLKPLSFSKHLRGGLLCVWKDDLEAVNGWNEEFTGWGLEDTELVFRMFNYGISFKKIKFQAITYHLWHEQQTREQISRNQELLDNTIQKGLLKCRKGLVLLS